MYLSFLNCFYFIFRPAKSFHCSSIFTCPFHISECLLHYSAVSSFKHFYFLKLNHPFLSTLFYFSSYLLGHLTYHIFLFVYNLYIPRMFKLLKCERFCIFFLCCIPRAQNSAWHLIIFIYQDLYPFRKKYKEKGLDYCIVLDLNPAFTSYQFCDLGLAN